MSSFGRSFSDLTRYIALANEGIRHSLHLTICLACIKMTDAISG